MSRTYGPPTTDGDIHRSELWMVSLLQKRTMLQSGREAEMDNHGGQAQLSSLRSKDIQPLE